MDNFALVVEDLVRVRYFFRCFDKKYACIKLTLCWPMIGFCKQTPEVHIYNIKRCAMFYMSYINVKYLIMMVWNHVR